VSRRQAGKAFGGSDGPKWSDPFNGNTDTLPDAGDDAVPIQAIAAYAA
jgi:hypothetical protein